MIYIRADANKTIGSGHVMRCLSIAVELKKRGMDVEFLLSGEESAKPIEGTELYYRVLHTDWQQLGSDDEVALIAPILSSNKSKPVLLVDSYLSGNEYFQKIRSYSKLVVIDDLFKDVYDADVVINYTIQQKLFDYAGAYLGKKTKLLLGTQYTPLREQFSGLNVECKMSDDSLQILLICGGGDPFHALSEILEYGLRSKLIGEDVYHVVVGMYQPDIDRLKRMEYKCGNIHIHQNVMDMATLMSQCDIAVSAAGTTLYECCAVGLPAVFFCMADNQRYDGLCFSEAGLLYAGDIRFRKEQCISNIFSHTAYLKKNLESRLEMSRRMTQLVDGNGSRRIAEEIGRLYEA